MGAAEDEYIFMGAAETFRDTGIGVVPRSTPPKGSLESCENTGWPLTIAEGTLPLVTVLIGAALAEIVLE